MNNQTGIEWWWARDEWKLDARPSLPEVVDEPMAGGGGGGEAPAAAYPEHELDGEDL